MEHQNNDSDYVSNNIDTWAGYHNYATPLQYGYTQFQNQDDETSQTATSTRSSTTSSTTSDEENDEQVYSEHDEAEESYATELYYTVREAVEEARVRGQVSCCKTMTFLLSGVVAGVAAAPFLYDYFDDVVYHIARLF